MGDREVLIAAMVAHAMPECALQEGDVWAWEARLRLPASEERIENSEEVTLIGLGKTQDAALGDLRLKLAVFLGEALDLLSFGGVDVLEALKKGAAR